jgi:hypothetical protein
MLSQSNSFLSGRFPLDYKNFNTFENWNLLYGRFSSDFNMVF